MDSGAAAKSRPRATALPPGQYLTRDFPVLSAGPTPDIPLDEWELSVTGAVDEPRHWSWAEFQALAQDQPTVDIHCVTSWTKLDTTWEGVSIDTLLDGLDVFGAYVVARSYGGYTTNLPLEDLVDGKAWIAYGFDGAPLEPEHGGPARAARAAPVLLEERQVDHRARDLRDRRAGLLGDARLPQLRGSLA